MTALSVMVNLELPHVNILTKMDLLSKSAKKQLDKWVFHIYFKILEFSSPSTKHSNTTYIIMLS